MSPGWTLTAREYRGLQALRWSPDGACILAGPNGSGKSTVLSALTFLAAAARRGIAEAVNSINGTAFLRRVGAVGNDPVFLSLAIGDLTWELRIPVSDRGVDLRWGEAIKLGGQVLGRRATFSDQMFFGATERAADERTVLKALWDFDRDERLRPLVDWTNSTRVYSDFWFNKVVQPQPANSDSFLNAHGTNVWSVLRSWKAAPRKYRDQFRWVEKALSEAFPDLVHTIEVDAEAMTTLPMRYAPGSEVALPMWLGPDGLLQAILVLVAVAGAQDRAVLAIDEMENFLHPHAIRSVLRSVRALADERHLTVILTTHSPVLMNEFKGHEENFFIMEPGRQEQPVRLTDARDPDWLAHFSLGDLYDREEFAAPARQDSGATTEEK